MAKRGNGEGTIYYSEKLNKWVGQFVVGRKPDGKINRKSVYGNTRKEVANKILEKQNEVNKNIFVEKNNITLIQIVDLYIQQLYESNTIKEVTYRRHLDTRRIITTLPIATMPIQNISQIQLNNSLSSITSYSNSIIDKVYGLINNAFNLAVLNKVLNTNPFTLKNAILKPKSKKNDKNIEALTVDEQNTLLKELSKTEDKYKNIFYIALFTGMRIGEILALKGSDIDLKNQRINISKTLTKDINDKVTIGHTTKTYAGTREIPFLTVLLPILKNYTSPNFLFLNNGNFINPSTINTHFKKICKDAGIKVTTMNKKKKNSYIVLKTSTVNTHMLRHTFATRCIESGMSAVVLQKLLGHKDIETTLNTYTSVFDQFKEDELMKAEKYFQKINKDFKIL